MPNEQTARPGEEYVVQMKGITKVYPNGVAANQNPHDDRLGVK